eukprot:Phypoly_transcript_09329.p1 GENE.Phypoly_transcript_09329~~Phypoly_transcript_09329.p1  ORF type:complete len:463 (+),score=92.65 Phypoly_transcript_09329:36-1391(+)
MAAKVSQAEYLKKYMSGSSGGGDDKKPKRKKVKTKPTQAFKIVDADEEARLAALNKPIEVDEEEMPVVVQVIEKPRPQHAYAKSNDGSGWTTVDEGIKNERTDSSPPRRRRVDADSSPPRRGRVDADNSPPRRGRVDTDSSPPRRGRVDADNSPPRRGRAGADNSPPRRGRVDADNSPPRRGRVDADNSPPRRGRADADNSPPRRGRVDTDSSPPRRGRVDTDSSPPRRGRVDADNSPPRKRPADTEREASAKKAVVMSSGVSAGLHKGETIRKQAEEKMRLEKERLSKLDPKDLGKDEATVFRDRRGRRLQGLEQFLRQQDGKFTATEEDDMEWGKGKVQKQQKEDEQKRLEEEANKPFARTKDDPELDAHFRDIDRWGDPMLGLVRKKPKSNKPVYKGPPGPANRFNIQPGYRWDGINRSNGFEVEYFKHQANKQALKDEGYLWSVADM